MISAPALFMYLCFASSYAAFLACEPLLSLRGFWLLVVPLLPLAFVFSVARRSRFEEPAPGVEGIREGSNPSESQCEKTEGVADFVYSSLPSQHHIRLCTLLAGQGDQPIQCSIKTILIKDEIYYEALSYVWGPPDEAIHIECDGAQMAVRANLGAALYRLRHHDRDCVLWIDRI